MAGEAQFSAYDSTQPEKKPFMTRSDAVVAVLLALVMAAGIYFRFVGQNWDDFTHLHPDERFLTQVADNLNGALNPTDPDPASRAEHLQRCIERYPQTNGIGSFFDSECSNWYPKNVGHGLYVYGELPMFVVRIMGELTADLHVIQLRYNACTALPGAPPFTTCLNSVLSNESDTDLARRINQNVDPDAITLARAWTGYNGIHLIGRSVSAVTELLSLIFVFLIGRRLYNKWVGLLAVAFAAAAVFPIQLAHFWTTDAFTNLPVTMTVYFAVRAKDRARFIDFALAGTCFGLAIASRINTLPLIIVIVLAAALYAVPAIDNALPRGERFRLMGRAAAGLALALLCGFISFRFTNPHAFIGGPGLLGVFDIRPYPPFWADVAQAQYLTSGNADFPPNHQWASRTPYVFPARNMILWGMGLPLGLLAWFGFGWAGWQILRSRPLWTQHVILVAWVLIYFGYMGRLWVMTMRYYMPLYPFLFILGAWALYEIVTRAYRWAQRNPAGAARIAYLGSVGLLLFALAFTYLWAAMFTSIYRRQLTRVEASYWFYRSVPAGFSTTITASDGASRLVNIPMGYGGQGISVDFYENSERKITTFIPQSELIDRVTVSRLVDPDRAGAQKTFYAAIAADPDGTQLLTRGRLQADFDEDGAIYGKSYIVPFDTTATVEPGRGYYLVTWSDGRLALPRIGGDSVDFTINYGTIPVGQARLPDAEQDQPFQASAVFDSTPITFSFKAPMDGSFERIEIAHLLNPLKDNRETALQIIVTDEVKKKTLANAVLRVRANSTRSSPFGDPYTLALETPINVTEGQQLTLSVSTLDGGPAQVTGSVVATEGPWDDPVPQKVCELPAGLDLSERIAPGMFNSVTCKGIDPWGTLYKGLELYMAAEDDEQKQQIMQRVLDQTDYITISSNRFYDSLSRLPLRFPMSIRFYDALFAGQLGFDLVKTVSSSYALGPLQVSDQHLPIYTSPKWLNEWEAEEAFHVYDHPTVFIFKKNPDTYNPNFIAQVLDSTPLNDTSRVSLLPEDPTLISVVRWGALQSTAAPTGFEMDSTLAAIQTQGGTWSELFNRAWAINQQPVFTVAAWWLAIMLIGFAVWPILYAILPGLPDRGYPMAKIAGLLIIGWIAWAGGALRFLTWSQGGLLIILLALAGFSALIAWRKRREFFGYVRLNWRHFVIVEVITLVMFVAFVFVRLGNPDLWAQVLGGEKPMDFTYFNAVLRSTVFPPYDPWFAGGYMNYYYFGYVIVGVPVKLLGVMPSIAYNLIVPTLFAVTGIGAFSLAFNIAAGRWFFPREEGRGDKDAPYRERRLFALRTLQVSPYLAGTLAILLCVVLGNLTTPSVFMSGVARAGNCPAETADMYLWKISTFFEREGRQPTPEESQRLVEEAANPTLGDQIAYMLYNLRTNVTCLSRGIGETLKGGYLPIGPDRWFWAARSVLGELPGASNEINEFPYFTFVYGDLHAHVIALPITMLAVGWLLSEIFSARYEKRATWVVVLATAFGGLAVGNLRATNTWDWITYLILGLVGLAFAILLRRQRITRTNLTAWVAQIGWFFAANLIAALPFTAFFATAYSSVKAFEGNKTPIWAYFTMHGTFLFIVISLLVWQTARLLRHSYVRDFIGRAWPLVVIAAVTGFTFLVALIMALVPVRIALLDMPIPLALLILPLFLWCAVLFLIPGQTREWQVVYAMIGLALAVSLGVEIVVLDGDIGRQNTFFKFYIQVWMLLSVASGVGAAWLLGSLRNWQPATRNSWLAVLVLLFGVAGLYPIMATQGRNAMRMAPEAPNTLDGNEYMAYAVYYEGSQPVPMADDLQIIRWLQDNVKGTPAILEAHQYPSEYKYGARIAINTGLPTVLGWRFHQTQQRTLDPLPSLVNQREANVMAMYNTPDITLFWRMAKFYNLEYIVVGKLEQITYQAAGLAKFERMAAQGLLETVYDQNGDRIYRIVPGATPNPTVVGQEIRP